MPTGAMTSAGTTLAISASLPASYNETGFEALSYTDVGEITVLPVYGKQFNITPHTPLGDRKTYKFKGSYDNGDVAIEAAKDYDDAGQLIVQAALESDDSYSFEVTMNDGSIEYFTAKVYGYPTEVNDVNSITKTRIMLAIDSDVVFVAA